MLSTRYYFADKRCPSGYLTFLPGYIVQNGFKAAVALLRLLSDAFEDNRSKFLRYCGVTGPGIQRVFMKVFVR